MYREDIEDCEQSEYDNAGYFVSKIDETLNYSISELSPSKTNQLLGYLDLQSMFSMRVAQLFEDQLCCAREVQSIKMKYMKGEIRKDLLNRAV